MMSEGASRKTNNKPRWILIRTLQQEGIRLYELEEHMTLEDTEFVSDVFDNRGGSEPQFWLQGIDHSDGKHAADVVFAGCVSWNFASGLRT